MYKELVTNLSRIALGIVGLGGLTFGLLTGYAHGFALDIVNYVTIGASIVVLISAMCLKNSDKEHTSVQAQHL